MPCNLDSFVVEIQKIVFCHIKKIVFCHIKISMPIATFSFGHANEHQVRMVCNYFGRERYFVDEKLVFSRWSLHFRGVREFEAAGHRIRIDLSANIKRVDANGFVDGVLVAPDLFAELNKKFAHQRKPQNFGVMFLIWFVIGIVMLTLLRHFNIVT